MERCATPGRPTALTPSAATHVTRRTIRYRTSSCLLADYESFVSRGFLFVSSRHPAAEGSWVQVSLQCDEVGLRITVRGRVVRVHPFGNLTNDAPGMLLKLPESERAALQRIEALAQEFQHVRRMPAPEPLRQAMRL